MVYQVQAMSRYVWGCAWVCAGMCGCVWVRMCMVVRGDVHGYVWDEFSEYLLENRVPTSADFNTYPIRIFTTISLYGKIRLTQIAMDTKFM